jgi:hypothetical protein
MSCILRFFCDECQRETRVEVQWSSCPDNGWKNYDFCGYQCADKFRDRMMSEKGNATAVPTQGDTPR